MVSLPVVGDIVSILVPGNYVRYGKVIETDYHPYGLHDAVKIQIDDELDKNADWWNTRWVIKEPREADNEAKA